MFNSLIRLFFSKTAKHTYLVSFGNGLAILCAFVFTVTLFRLLSYSDFGYFSALWSLILLVSDISDLGIGNSLSRFLPPLEGNKKRLHSFLRTAFFLQLGIALFAAGAVFFFSPFISDILFHNREFIYLVKITSLGIFGYILFNFFIYGLSARQKFVIVCLLTSLGGLVRVGFLFLLIAFSLLNLSNVVWIQSIVFFVLLPLGFIFIEWKFLKTKRTSGDLKKLIFFSSFLGASRSLTAISSRLDVLMLVALAGPSQAGIYATASRVISVYPLFTGSFILVLGPKIASMRNKIEVKRLLKKVILATGGFISSIMLLIAIAHPFMIILFSSKSAPAVSVLRLLLLAMIFFVGSVPSVSLAIYFLKKPYILTINSILQLVIVVLGNLIFIPLWGNLGPAISLILAYGVSFVLTSYLSYYYWRKEA